MNGDELFATCFVCGLFGAVLLTVAILVIHDIAYKCSEKKKKKNHPWFFQKLDERDRLMTLSCKVHNTEIAPRKRMIDAILREWDYLTDELRERKQKELDSLRRMIAEYQKEEDALDERVRAIREELRTYNNEHKVYKNWD